MKKIVLCLLATCFMSLNALAEREIKGQVVYAADGEPLIGATVLPVGGGNGSATDFDGNFAIVLPDDVKQVTVSYVGMKTQTLDAVDGMVVKMEDNTNELEEVVVTAFGMKRERKALGYAVQDLKSEDLNTKGTTDLANAIQGKVSGVDIRPSSGMPGASTNIIIRGARSFEQTNQPLYVIDGMPVSTESDFRNYSNNAVSGTTYSQRSIDINPEDIESINILKGQAASALYGIRASNGVILITTKRGSGEVGKPRVTLTTSFSADLVSRPFEHQTTYAQGSGGLYSPSNSATWGPKISELPNDPNYGGNTNNAYTQQYGMHQGMYYVPQRAAAGLDPWAYPQAYDNIKDFFQVGTTWSNNVNVAQAFDKGHYSFSIGNTTQDGIIPNTGMDRYNAKMSAEARLHENWTTGFSGNYVNSKISKQIIRKIRSVPPRASMVRIGRSRTTSSWSARNVSSETHT